MTLNILNLLPSSIYWIQEDTKTFLGCNQYFFTIHNDLDKGQAIEKSIDRIFSGEYLNFINNLLKKNTQHLKKAAVYFGNLGSSNGPLLIQYARSPEGKAESL